MKEDLVSLFAELRKRQFSKVAQQKLPSKRNELIHGRLPHCVAKRLQCGKRLRLCACFNFG